jgi:hypothetical protein
LTIHPKEDLEQLPLYSEHAQRACLGSALLDNSMLWGPLAELNANDLVGDDHRAIFKVLRELGEDRRPFDVGLVADRLSRDGDRKWFAVVGELVDGAVPDCGIVKRHVQNIQRLAALRSIYSLAVALERSATADAQPEQLHERIKRFFNQSSTVSGASTIRRFEDIPDILTRKLPDLDLIVPALGIAANTVGLWTGGDGEGKTYLAQSMALSVSRGETFLGMKCRQRSVVYIDLENPAFMVQNRVRTLAGDDEPQRIPLLKIWGDWDSQVAVPHAGSELLLTICKETKPLVIVDPFLYFHTAKENDAGEMSSVMQYLRALAAYGCGVVLLHHPAKTEGSTGRGSSAIRGACDFAFLQSLDKESSVITLKVDKNRNGATPTFTIRADFEEGKFELIDSPYLARRNSELEKLEQIIADNPGITQNAIVKKSSGMKSRIGRLLKEEIGTRWVSKLGSNRSTNYYPLEWFSNLTEPLRTTEPPREQIVGGSGGSPLRGGEPPNHDTETICSGGSAGWAETII